MLDLRLRPMKERALDGAARRLARRVPAGALTGFSLASTLAAAGAAWAGWPVLAVAGWLVGRLLDGLDGPVARARGTETDLGGYLDQMADTIGYTVVPLGVALAVDDRATWVAVAVLLGVLYVNAISWAYPAAVLEKRGAGARATGELTSVTMPPALIEGTETIVLYTLFLAFPAQSAWLFGLMAGLVTVNLAQRLVWARRALR